MKIAFTTKEPTWTSPADPRFGRTNFFVIYDEETETTTVIDNKEAAGQAHGAGPLAAGKLAEANPQVLITGNGPGEKAARVLKNMNLEIYLNEGNNSPKESYRSFKRGELKKFEL